MLLNSSTTSTTHSINRAALAEVHAGPWEQECFQLSRCLYVIISAHNNYISFFMTHSSNQEERRKEQKREKMIEIEREKG